MPPCRRLRCMVSLVNDIEVTCSVHPFVLVPKDIGKAIFLRGKVALPPNRDRGLCVVVAASDLCPFCLRSGGK
jgi:hypothetical protein